MKSFSAILTKLWRRICAIANLARGRGLSAEIFDLLYLVRPDPWRYRTSKLERGKYDKILSVLPQRRFGKSLELGCSEGIFTQMLAPQTATLTAVDFSPTALQRAAARLKGSTHVDFLNLDLKLQDPGSEYDLIVASEVLYYLGDVPQIRAVGRRMLSWLNPSGYLVLCHMRTQTDEAEGFPKPRFVPSHPGAFTVHGLFDEFPELTRLSQYDHPLYRVSVYQRA